MLTRHVAAQDDTLLVVDSDCDGYTSAALVYNYLYNLFPAFVQNHIFIQIHDDKFHGIELSEVTSKIKFVIVPDASSNQYEEHAALAERGVDILILDHHEAEMESSHACVINN